MADFINTIDVLGDDAVFDSIINRTITEFNDDRITSVREYAFCNCANLAKVDIPSAVTIKYNSFSNCASLASVNIPAVTKIEAYNAFSSCKALKEIVLPVCSYIGQGAFSFCSRLEKVDCAVTGSLEIGNSAFGSTTALKALVIRSNSVATMASKNALHESSIYFGTGHIYVPSALYDSYRTANNWSAYASQFRKLEEWTVDGTVTGELAIDGRHRVRFFNEDGTLLSYVIVPTGSYAVYPGDEPVKEGEWAFMGWNPAPVNVTADMDCYAQFRSTAVVSRKLVDRTISGDYVNDRVESIGYRGFMDCKNLTSVYFPAAISIGDSAFGNCSNLKTAILPAVASVKYSTFSNCSALETVDLHAVTSVSGYYTFDQCKALTALILRNTTQVATLDGTSAFNGSTIKYGTGYIYVPKSLLSDDDATKDYRRATNWSAYAAQFRAIEDYPDICGGDV